MVAVVDKTSSVPLYVQIQDALHEQIRSGELPPGAQVPSEPELAAHYHVSRMTARKALNGLVAKGLLFRQQGKGTFVAENLMSYDLSTMLSFSRTLMARGYRVTTKVLRQELIPGPPAVTEQLELSPGREVVLVRRLRFVEDRPSAIHTAYMDARVYASILEVDLSSESLLTAIERISGTSMAYSRDSVQAALAKPEDAVLLEIPKGSPVLELEGLTFGESGQPSRFNKAVYRGDLFRLVVTNTRDQVTSLKVTDIPDRSTSE